MPKGKSPIITGSTSGIGLTIAHGLIGAGCKDLAALTVFLAGDAATWITGAAHASLMKKCARSASYISP